MKQYGLFTHCRDIRRRTHAGAYTYTQNKPVIGQIVESSVLDFGIFVKVDTIFQSQLYCISHHTQYQTAALSPVDWRLLDLL